MDFRREITIDPTGIVVVSLVFVLGAPVVLGAIAILLNQFASNKSVIPYAIPIIWLVLVVHGDLQLTLAPTLIASILMWMALRVTPKYGRSLVGTPGRMVFICAVFGGISALLAYVLVAVTIQNMAAAELGSILFLAMPTGAILGAFIGCLAIADLEYYLKTHGSR